LGPAVAAADDGPRETRRPVFQTEKVRRGNMTPVISATGTLQPEEMVDIGTEVLGHIERLGADPNEPSRHVDFGTRVEKGTVLAQLDASPYKARREQAQAGLAKAEAGAKVEGAQLRLAERERERVRKRLAERAATPEDLDVEAARCELSAVRVLAAQAAVEEARAAFREAELNLGYTTIRSPIKGVIVDRRVNVGQAVTAAANAPTLFLVASDLKRMQLWVAVNEADAPGIRPGQTARFTVDAYPDRIFRGKVSQCRPNATLSQQKEVTYTAVVEVDNADNKLLPYLTADVQIRGEERKDVLLVPNAALRWEPPPQQSTAGDRAEQPPAGKAPPRTGVVWIEGESSCLRPVRLRLGVSDGVMTVVVGGELAEGQQVVTGKAATSP
jgi:HlyD family secretion protein